MQQKPNNEIKEKIIRLIIFLVVFGVLYFLLSDGDNTMDSTFRQLLKGIFR